MKVLCIPSCFTVDDGELDVDEKMEMRFEILEILGHGTRISRFVGPKM